MTRPTFNQLQLLNWLDTVPPREVTTSLLVDDLKHTGATYDAVFNRLCRMERHGWVRRSYSYPVTWKILAAGKKARRS